MVLGFLGKLGFWGCEVRLVSKNVERMGGLVKVASSALDCVCVKKELSGLESNEMLQSGQLVDSVLSINLINKPIQKKEEKKTLINDPNRIIK